MSWIRREFFLACFQHYRTALAEEEMLKKTQWQRRAEQDRLRKLEMEKYHEWELSGLRSKQQAKKEEDFAMKMRQNMYMSNFYGASNTVKLYSVVKKSFFPNLTRLRFWPANYFVHAFYTCYAYNKCLLEFQKTFGTNWSITRHVEMITRQEKVILVDFMKTKL